MLQERWSQILLISAEGGTNAVREIPQGHNEKIPLSRGMVEYCNSLPRGLETLFLEVSSIQLGKALDHLIHLPRWSLL